MNQARSTHMTFLKEGNTLYESGKEFSNNKIVLREEDRIDVSQKYLETLILQK